MKRFLGLLLCGLIFLLPSMAQIGVPGGPDTYIPWVAQVSGTSAQLRSVYFVGPNTGWVVGANGTVLKTISGGTLWAAQTSNTTQTLNSCYFVSTNTGWAVGSSGTIIKTNDGGSTWAAQTSNTTTALYGVSFVDANIGWCAGGTGTILKTINGGGNWVPQVSNTTTSFYDIAFKDANTGFAVGNNGIVHKTINGGSNWAAQVSGATVGLNCASVPTATKAYLFGDGGKILSTVNGGANWATQVSGTSNSFAHASFINDSSGWAVGDGGTVVRTTNSGSTWSEQLSGTSANLNGNFMVDSSTGWLVGNNGTILKYFPYHLLPLTLLEYAVNVTGTDVLCHWNTCNEINTSHFTIQKSVNGIEFTDAGTVAAGGNKPATQSYIFLDVGAFEYGKPTLYYRLKMVDKDGRFTLSKTIALTLNQRSQALVIFPNPVKESLTLQLATNRPEKATILVTDMQGKVLQQQQRQLNAGSTSIWLNTSLLAKGTYILVVKGTVERQKQFVKE